MKSEETGPNRFPTCLLGSQLTRNVSVGKSHEQGGQLAVTQREYNCSPNSHLYWFMWHSPVENTKFNQVQFFHLMLNKVCDLQTVHCPIDRNVMTIILFKEVRSNDVALTALKLPMAALRTKFEILFIDVSILSCLCYFSLSLSRTFTRQISVVDSTASQ